MSEIEKFPRAVLAHHYPGVPCHGDFTTIQKGDYEPIDLLVGGTPCFVKGHMVLCEEGYKPIEEVVVGDRVVTHLGRLKRVLAVGSKKAAVGKLKGIGVPEGFIVTADHPFLSVDWSNQNTKRGNAYAKIEKCGEPEWNASKDMPGLQWCSLLYYYVPLTPYVSSTKFDTKEAMYVAGMYLGDGHIRKWSDKNKKALVLSLNDTKLSRLQKAGIDLSQGTITQEATSTRITFCDTVLCDWLIAHFGQLSHEKHIPAWVMDHPNRRDFMQGYLDTDGCVRDNCVTASTVSKSLAYGVADILNSEGYVASVTLIKTTSTCVIEGRTVRQRDWYQIAAFPEMNSRKSRVRHGYLLRTVQSFTPIGEDKVFNIEVDEDNSYVCNGIVVHNCQGFSIAGLRGGLDDDRSNLALGFVRLLDRLKPRWFVWENVPGCLSTNGGRDFGAILGGVAEVGYGFSWRILDAQFFGVPQRRRRVFLVGYLGDWRPAAAVLFEPESMLGNPAPSRKARQAIAPTISARAKGGGGLGTDLDGGLIAGTLLNNNNKAAGSATSQDAESGLLIPEVACCLSAARGRAAAAANDASLETYVPVTRGPCIKQTVTATIIARDGRCFVGTNYCTKPQNTCAREGMPTGVGYDLCKSVCGQLNHAEVNAIKAAGEASLGATLYLEGHTYACDRCKASMSEAGITDYVIGAPPTSSPLAFGGNNQSGPIDVATACNAHGGPAGRLDFESETFIAQPIAIQERAISENPNARPDGMGVRTDGIAYTLEARMVPQAVVFDTTQITSKTNRSNPQYGDPSHPLTHGGNPPTIAFSCKDYGADASDDIAPTLRAMGHDGSHANAGGQLAIAFPSRMSATQYASTEELSPALAALNPTAVAYDMRGREGGAQFEGPHDTANIRAAAGGSSRSYVQTHAVRRLTPRECERLQGFQDDFTLVKSKVVKKITDDYFRYLRATYPEMPRADAQQLAADGPRYKALGNSMAVPVMSWIGRRILAVNELITIWGL